MKRGILLKPLNGQPIGSECSYSERDFEALKRKGAVAEIPDEPVEAPKPPKRRKKG